jgi:hypothetical protein
MRRSDEANANHLVTDFRAQVMGVIFLSRVPDGFSYEIPQWVERFPHGFSYEILPLETHQVKIL